VIYLEDNTVSINRMKKFIFDGIVLPLSHAPLAFDHGYETRSEAGILRKTESGSRSAKLIYLRIYVSNSHLSIIIQHLY